MLLSQDMFEKKLSAKKKSLIFTHLFYFSVISSSYSSSVSPFHSSPASFADSSSFSRVAPASSVLPFLLLSFFSCHFFFGFFRSFCSFVSEFSPSIFSRYYFFLFLLLLILPLHYFHHPLLLIILLLPPHHFCHPILKTFLLFSFQSSKAAHRRWM